MAWAGGNHGDKDSAQARVGHPADCPGVGVSCKSIRGMKFGIDGVSV